MLGDNAGSIAYATVRDYITSHPFKLTLEQSFQCFGTVYVNQYWICIPVKSEAVFLLRQTYCWLNIATFTNLKTTRKLFSQFCVTFLHLPEFLALHMRCCNVVFGGQISRTILHMHNGCTHEVSFIIYFLISQNARPFTNSMRASINWLDQLHKNYSG